MRVAPAMKLKNVKVEAAPVQARRVRHCEIVRHCEVVPVRAMVRHCEVVPRARPSI